MTKTSDTIGNRSGCPIACSLDVLGDKWTLLIVRDLAIGKHRFADFETSLEGIPTNTLADRLRRMEQNAVVEKIQYADKPPRFEYHLTAKGKALLPVLQELSRWAQQHMPESSLQGSFIPRSNERRQNVHRRRRLSGGSTKGSHSS
jgi:DNA-binding HxlR family transcriptional regulator